VAIAILFALGTMGCAPTIMVTRERPAEINLRGVKRIAVMAINGSGGTEIQGLLSEQLATSNRFDVLERAQLEKILAEHQLSARAEMQEGDLAIGKVLPASALVGGTIDRSEYNQNKTSTRTTCSRAVKVGRKFVSQNYPCTENKLEGKAIVSVQLRVFDTSSARILAARTLKDEQAATTNATDGEPEPIDGNELKQKAYRNISENFLKIVAPYKVSEKVKLVDHGDLPEVTQGNEYLKRGDHSTAVEYYGKAVARANADASMKPKVKGTAHYALGLGLALVGDYSTALAEIRAANALVQDSDWLDTEVRVKQWASEADQVNKQKKENGPTEPSASASTSGEVSTTNLPAVP